MGADASTRAGALNHGRHGAAKAGESGGVAWVPTLLRGRPRSRHDLVRQPRTSSPVELLLIIVDASASTKRNGALSEAKGLLSRVFDDAYRRRVRLALLTASGATPRWQHQGVKASHALQPWLDSLGSGGGTPLHEAIEQARQWLERRRKRHPAERQRLMLLTDGRVRAMPGLSAFACESVLIDIEMGAIRLGRALELAERLGAEYRHIEALPPTR